MGKHFSLKYTYQRPLQEWARAYLINISKDGIYIHRLKEDIYLKSCTLTNDQTNNLVFLIYTHKKKTKHRFQEEKMHGC